MSSDDQMNSNDLAGRLGYIAPSVAALMGQDDYSNFNGEFLPTGYVSYETGQTTLKFELIIQNNADGWDVQCSHFSNCVYSYRRESTPLLLDTTPPNVAAGQELYFNINAMQAHAWWVTPEDQPPYRTIHMGQYLLDMEDIVEDDERLNWMSHDTQYAIMTDVASSNSTEPRILFYNGLARVMRSATHCNFAGDDCWTVRVHPRIKSVSYNEGYTTGGQTIRIDGMALNGTNIEVLADGEECRVTDSGLDYIKCVTGGTGSVSPVGYQPGQVGITQIQTDADYEEFMLQASTFEAHNVNSS
jgi:acylphosphatase